MNQTSSCHGRRENNDDDAGNSSVHSDEQDSTSSMPSEASSLSSTNDHNNPIMSPSPPSSSSSYYVTLDILTDGSEHTGEGCGNLFLSIWKRSKIRQQQQRKKVDNGESDVKSDLNFQLDNPFIADVLTETESDHDGQQQKQKQQPRPQQADHPSPPSPPPLLARYAIGGIGDGFGRLCADQNFKIAPIRAVFLPSSSCVRRNVHGGVDDDTHCGSSAGNNQVDGIAGLLLALVAAGSPSLHVVIPSDWNTQNINNNSDALEELSSLILGRYRQLDIRTCHLPNQQQPQSETSDPSKTSSTPTTWWKVYDDEYIEVHAGMVEHRATTSNVSSDNQEQQQQQLLVYLFTFSHFAKSFTSLGPNSTSALSTLMVIPPGCYQQDIPNIVDTVQQQNLPIIGTDGIPISIHHIVALGAKQAIVIPTKDEVKTKSDNTQNTGHDRVKNEMAERKLELLNEESSVSSAGPNETLSSSTNSDPSGLLTVWTTLPQERNDEHHDFVDSGILMRSQQLAKYFNNHMPWAFPVKPIVSSSPASLCKPCHFDSNELKAMMKNQSNVKFRKLESGTSLLFHPPVVKTKRYNDTNISVIDRRHDVWRKSIRDEWQSTLQSLMSFVPRSESLQRQYEQQTRDVQVSTKDENEIDIDSDDDDGASKEVEEDEPSQKISPALKSSSDEFLKYYDEKRPYLIALGTNCATPSAYRGSSSYVLVRPTHPSNIPNMKDQQHGLTENQNSSVPSVDLYMLDCGEGTATMLSRHCGPMIGNWKRRIKGIWISHAHLDHYGGLPTLLRILHTERMKSVIQKPFKGHNQKADVPTIRHPSKRVRLTHNDSDDDDRIPDVPWVMAPAKVLRYLDILLQSRHGKDVKDSSIQYFHPLLHHDPTAPPGNWLHFENVRVDHSCCPSFGLIVGWKNDDNNDDGDNFTSRRMEQRNGDDCCHLLCFSGDTRPTFRLVQACRNALRRCNTIIGDNYRTQSYHHQSHYSNAGGARSTFSSSLLLLPPPPPPATKLFLIHEATFDDTEQRDAQQKKHSTLSEAIQVSNDIPATRVLLTHFSQRYVSLSIPTTPTNRNRYQQQQQRETNNNQTLPIGLAVDGLWIPL